MREKGTVRGVLHLVREWAIGRREGEHPAERRKKKGESKLSGRRQDEDAPDIQHYLKKEKDGSRSTA